MNNRLKLQEQASRRRFLQSGVAASALAFTQTGPHSAPVSDSDAASPLPPAFANLKPLGSRGQPITPAEFAQRIEKAQKLMTDSPPKFDALFLAPGTGLYYFSSVRWWPSERLLGLLIPRTGDPIMVAPGFEEGRLRERLKNSYEIRVWQEDQSPTAIAAAALADRGIRTGRIGIDETTFFTFFDHFRTAAPGLECVSADPITIACRAIKSAHELDLMRAACDATFDVFRATFASLKLGMSQDDIGSLIERGFAKMGLKGGALTLIGASAALPHGSIKPATLKENDVVLIDGGTNVEGYASDVTRTGVVLGKPSEKVARVYEIIRKAQDAALDAARAGRLSGTVDDAARAVITAGGYGPDYKFFTHRLGHGMGLDGHEHPYLVRGSKTVLQPGMTFSDEPGIYIPGEFGLRCEDDMVITADGPAKLLTQNFPVSLEKPFG
jgi:Xaa-Pro dipeptidase